MHPFNPQFPTGTRWEKAKKRARKLQKEYGLGYTEAFVRVAEENAVVLPTVDKIRDWLLINQEILRKHKIEYLTPRQLQNLQREQLFLLTYELHRLRNDRRDQKVWFYCHAIPCGACQHDNYGTINRSDASDCMECEGRGFKLWPARTQDYDLNQKLLTAAMWRRLEGASAEPTAWEIVRDIFPPFVVRTSEIGQEEQDKLDRDFPEIAYNGPGAEDSDNPDIYEDLLFN